jgi:putative acetyltransferase
MSTVVDLADQWLNLSRLELEVYTDNDAAIHLYERFGFEIEGTHRLHSYGDGRWSDSYFMARVRTP